MYCPKCGEALKANPDGLYCQSGDMYLSQYMEQRLINCFVFKTEVPSSIRFRVKVGGKWFCPECGIRLNEVDGYIRCSKCHRSINEFVHQLIELHPHRNWLHSIEEDAK
jgi:hypothetical protein